MRVFRVGSAAASRSAVAADSFVALLFLTVLLMVAFAATAFGGA